MVEGNLAKHRKKGGCQRQKLEMPGDDECRQCMRRCMGARTRRDTRRTLDPMSWQQQILMEEFNESGFRQGFEEQVSGGHQRAGGRRVRRAAGTINSWTNEAPHTFSGIGAGRSDEGKYLQSKNWADADWSMGVYKHWSETGKNEDGASVGGVGWAVEEQGQVMRGNMGWLVEGEVMESSNMDEVARNANDGNGVMRQRRRGKRNATEQTENIVIPNLATGC